MLGLHAVQLHDAFGINKTLQSFHLFRHRLLPPVVQRQVKVLHLRNQVLVLESEFALDKLIRHEELRLFPFLQFLSYGFVKLVAFRVESAQALEGGEGLDVFALLTHLLDPGVVDYGAVDNARS
jgi:hypothetical protein